MNADVFYDLDVVSSNKRNERRDFPLIVLPLMSPSFHSLLCNDTRISVYSLCIPSVSSKSKSRTKKDLFSSRGISFPCFAYNFDCSCASHSVCSPVTSSSSNRRFILTIIFVFGRSKVTFSADSTSEPFHLRQY